MPQVFTNKYYLPSINFIWDVALHNSKCKICSRVIIYGKWWLLHFLCFSLKKLFLFSYCDINQTSHSSYRAYAPEIPEFLVNWPKTFIKHCLMKINEAKHYDKTGIVMVANGKFRLLSFQEGSRKVYHVSYGDDLNMPSCTCYNWLDSAYLCIHLFAIMEKYPSGVGFSYLVCTEETHRF